MAASEGKHVPMEDNTSGGNSYEIEATIVTGFENVAKEDAEEHLGVQVKAGRGKITMHVPEEKLPQVRSIIAHDNTKTSLTKTYGWFCS